RQAKGVDLTDAGKRFLQRAYSIHHEVRRAQEEIEQLRGATKGIIHIGLSPVAQITLFPYAARAFHAKYTDTVLHILDGLYPTMEPNLKNGTIDIYVGPAHTQRPTPELSIEQLLDNQRGIICRKGHPLASTRSLTDLVNAEWVTTSLTFKAEHDLCPLSAQYGLPEPRPIFHAHSALSFVTAMVSSDALALLPICLAEL